MRKTDAMNIRVLVVTTLAVILLCSGCGGSPESDQQMVERIRSEAARILNKDSAQIDVAKPLSAQGADELDIVEIVLAIEEALDVQIPDTALGENVEDGSKTLTVQKLAEIASQQKKKSRG